jgi:FAD-linked oxidoreductase
LQPILLGAVFSEGTVGFDGLALAATLEIIAIGLALAMAAFWRERIRARAIGFLLATAIFNLLSASAAGAVAFIAWRGLAGLAEGALVAIATECIARSARPERSGGQFLILQTTAQCLLALVLSLWLIPAQGAAGGFEALAAICVATLLIVPWLPSSYAPLRTENRGQIAPLLRAPPAYALGSIFCFFLFIGAVWAFLEPLGAAGGIDAQAVGLMVSISLAVQVAGAAVATLTSGGRHTVGVLAGATLIALLVAGLFHFSPGYWMFGLAVMLTGFLWLFTTPFQIGLTVEADETRSTALLVPAAQLFGAALGPVGASVFLSGESAGAVPVFGAAALFASVGLLLGYRRSIARERSKTAGRARMDAFGWRNWSGSVLASPKRIPRPETVEELSSTILHSPGPIRIAGAGHSFTPLVQSSGTILDMSAFSGLLSHDAATNRATIGAQTRLGDLMPLLRGIGQGLPNMGDIDRQAFAGALGTATHGSGLTLGAYHTQLHAMTLVDGRGHLRHFSRETDEEMILATGVTLGAFGALTDVTIQNVPTYNLRRRRWIVPLAEILEGFESFMRGHRSAEFYFIPFSGHVMLCTCDLSEDAPTTRPTEDDEDSLATLKLLRTLLLRAPWLRRKLIGSALARVPAEDYVQEWQNVYTSDRRTRFNEMEYHLPFEAGAAALREIIEMAENHFPEVYFPMEVRSVAPDEFWLSPFYRRPTCSIAVHHDAAENPAAFMRAAEQIFRRYDGRPHWGKMHNLTAADFGSIYPRFRDAMEVRREFDPDNRFVSPYMARILGINA